MPRDSTIPATGRGPAGPDAEIRAELERLDALARTLDARFRIPLTGFRIGLDGLIGLIPGIGDTLALLPSGYLVARGWQLGARKRTLVRMGANTAVDYLVGLVPLVGDVLDIGYKGNLRNVALLRAEIAPEIGPEIGHGPPPRR
jgi:hypothetical protein